ncbi:MAG: hypothetical protein K2O63_02655 [Alistipes sp.]|nr:hypothetical protein [Alistipes sp.]MDE5730003.1 hypothetical protein [Alistipes sp.]MDE7069406.1 hypothetical protein [Alistipes sp.]
MMKINVVPALLALALGGLMLYGFLAFGAATWISVVAAVMATWMLVSLVAVRIAAGPHRTMLFRTVSAVLLVVTFAANVCFACFAAGQAAVVLFDGVAVVGWAAALYAAVSSGKRERE